MSSGFYFARDSFLHRLHPVTKILVTFLSFLSALIISHPLGLLILFVIYGLASARTGAFRGLMRVIWLLVLIAAASFAIWSLAYEGEAVVAAWGPFSITREGMIFGAGMGLRLDLMVFCGLVFLATTPVEEFSYGLTRLGLPFPISFAMSLSFRLVPLFSDTVSTILDAQRARGLDIDAAGPVKKMRGYVPLLVPVFSAALRRTDQLAIALESKGFGLGKKRGSLMEHRAGVRDAVAIAVMALILAAEVVYIYLGR